MYRGVSYTSETYFNIARWDQISIQIFFEFLVAPSLKSRATYLVTVVSVCVIVWLVVWTHAQNQSCSKWPETHFGF